MGVIVGALMVGGSMSLCANEKTVEIVAQSENGVTYTEEEIQEILRNTPSTPNEASISRVQSNYSATTKNTTDFVQLYAANNIINETVKVTPVYFSAGITSVDIIISWSQGTKTWTNVALGDPNDIAPVKVDIPINGGSYRILVKTNDSSGKVTAYVSDLGK